MIKTAEALVMIGRHVDEELLLRNETLVHKSKLCVEEFECAE